MIQNLGDLSVYVWKYISKRTKTAKKEKLPCFSISFQKTVEKHINRIQKIVRGKLQSVLTFLQRCEVERRKCFINHQFCARLKTQNFVELFKAKNKRFHVSIRLIYSCETFTQKEDVKGLGELSIFTRCFSNVTKNTDYYFPHLIEFSPWSNSGRIHIQIITEVLIQTKAEFRSSVLKNSEKKYKNWNMESDLIRLIEI